jgi:hypothetical protein
LNGLIENIQPDFATAGSLAVSEIDFHVVLMGSAMPMALSGVPIFH